MGINKKREIMIKIFFATFFIAELIIAFSLILKIYKLDKCVNNFNDSVSKNKIKLQTVFSDIRFLFKEFNIGFIKLKEIIKQKQQEYSLRFLKTSIIYLSIFLLRGRWLKYKKIILAYQVIKEVYEGYKEA